MGFCSSTNGGTVTNRYGLYLDDFNGTATNDYGLYQEGTQDNYFAGNVGIGTDSPDYPLEVATGGIFYISSDGSVRADRLIIDYTGASNIPRIKSIQDGRPIEIGYNGIRIGQSEADEANFADIEKNASETEDFIIRNKATQTNKNIIFETGDGSGNPALPRLTIGSSDPNGSGSGPVYFTNVTGVGIGTDSPTTPLSILSSGGSPVGITQNQVGGTSTMEFTTRDDSGNDATRILLRGNQDHAEIEFYRGARGSEVLIMVMDDDGRLGIGTADPDQGLLEVKGDTVCVDTNSDDNASSCIASESDARLKKNIEDMDYGLDTLMALRPVAFDWRHDDPKILKHYPLISRFAGQPHSIGLIAQDVQKLIPEAIEQETVGDDEEQYMQLDYDKLVPVLIKATQEQQVQIDKLEATNEALQSENTALETADQAILRRISALEEGQQAIIKSAVQPLAGESEANAIPSDAEFAELRAALDTRQAYIDKLETQIASLARDIEGLKATTGYDEGPPVWLKVITLLLLALAAILAVPVLRSRAGSQSQGAL